MCRLAQFATLILAGTFALHAAGCESSSTSRQPAPFTPGIPAMLVSQQLILKFKPNSIACNAQEIVRWSGTVGVPLEWLRPMSGDACVVIQKAGTPAELVKGQEALKKRGDVEWMEIDAPMQRH